MTDCLSPRRHRVNDRRHLSGRARAAVPPGIAAASLLVALLALTPAHGQGAPENARPCGSADANASPRILVTATGVNRVVGNVAFTLYGDRPALFLAHRGSIAIDRVPLTGPEATGCFVVSRPGTYAVAIYHDANDNRHFDRSVLGLPVEGYGFSRNAPIFLGPPAFASVRFAAGPGDTRLAIRLRY